MLIYPNKLSGQLTIQPSKSYLHRMIILSALSGEACTIENTNLSDDIKATLDGLATLGLATYEAGGNSIKISPGSGEISGKVDCNESGSTLRFLLPIALTLNKEVAFIGRGRLMERPQQVYGDLCKKQGFDFVQDGQEIRVKGQLTPGDYCLEGGTSSQFISGLALALSAIGGGSISITGKFESTSYVDITLDALKSFGVTATINDGLIKIDGKITSPKKIYCPGDWSHAANFACMGAVFGGITLSGLRTTSFQGDREIIDILISMGAQINMLDGSIILLPSSPMIMNIDGSNIPDLVPVLSVLMGALYGSCTISNVGRLRIKECDRIAATVDLINTIGGCAIAGEDSIIIEGTGGYLGGNVKTYNDHRIAMAAAVASVYCQRPIQIDNSSCVNKSAPNFWQEFESIGGEFKEEYYV